MHRQARYRPPRDGVPRRPSAGAFDGLPRPLRGGPTTVREALNALDSAGLSPTRIDLHEPTLERKVHILVGWQR